MALARIRLPSSTRSPNDALLCSPYTLCMQVTSRGETPPLLFASLVCLRLSAGLGPARLPLRKHGKTFISLSMRRSSQSASRSSTSRLGWQAAMFSNSLAFSSLAHLSFTGQVASMPILQPNSATFVSDCNMEFGAIWNEEAR